MLISVRASQFIFFVSLQALLQDLCGCATFCFFAAPIPFCSKNPVNMSHYVLVRQVARQPIAAATNWHWKTYQVCSKAWKQRKPYSVCCDVAAAMAQLLSQAVMLLAAHQPSVRAASVSFQPASFNRSSFVPFHHVRS